MLMCVFMYAQPRWERVYNPGDELHDVKPHYYYRYHSPGVGYVFVEDFDGWAFDLITDKGNFYTYRITFSDGRLPTYYVRAIIALYDMKGNLVDKIRDDMKTFDKDRTYAYICKVWNYQRKHQRFLKKALQALKNKEGYMRVVIERTKGADFDITIPPLDIELTK